MSLMLSYALAILIGLLGITVMIIIHELGHYAAAKAFGIRVDYLSFGFGPAWLKFRSKNGETVFKFCIIPFGGTCKMAGKEDIEAAISEGSKNVEMCEDGSIYSVSPFKRMITFLCGPLANIIFALVCYSILLTINVLVVFYPPKIALVSDYPETYPDMPCPAAEAGLKSGDTIYYVNGISVDDFNDISKLLSKYADSSEVLFVTDRGTFTVTPVDGKVGIIPFEKEYREEKGKPILTAIGISLKECFKEVKKFITSLISMFSGKQKVSSTISGTFGASAGIGLTAQRGFKAGFNAGLRVALYILASVSISMGVANLLPITALDGGLILVSFVELLIGKTLHPKAYVTLQVIGLAVIFIIIPLLKLLI